MAASKGQFEAAPSKIQSQNGHVGQSQNQNTKSEAIKKKKNTMNNEPSRAVKLYRQHSRARFVELGHETERHVGHFLDATGGDREGFFQTLEKLNDHFGLNLLRPLPKPERKFPEMWRDPVTGENLQNPFGTELERSLRSKLESDTLSAHARASAERELAKIRTEQHALEKNHPTLAQHLRRIAEEPWTYLFQLKAEEYERQASNAREEAYFSSRDNHLKNPFVSGTPGDQSEFAKECGLEVAELYRREAKQVSIPLFGKTRNHTLLGKIAMADKPLLEIVKAAQQCEKEFEAAQFEQAKVARREAAIRAEAERQMTLDRKFGVVRLPDGRIITGMA